MGRGKVGNDREGKWEEINYDEGGREEDVVHTCIKKEGRVTDEDGKKRRAEIKLEKAR